MEDASARAEDALWTVWKRLSGKMGMILGTDVELSRPEQGQGWSPPEQGYVGVMEVKGEEPGHAFVVVDLPTAIASAGVMVMMQEPTIASKMEKLEFDGDDFDAMGEFINQFGSVANEVLKERADASGHLVFKRGLIEFDDLPEVKGAVTIGGEIKIGDLVEGRLDLVFPAQLLGLEEPAADDGPGVELSSEELAAIREATKSMGDVGKTMLLVPVKREREAWSTLLDGTELDFEYASDLHELQAAIRNGACSAALIDADACPSGGLPALARLRTKVGLAVPAVVVASSPTRTHVVSCMAAGVSAYLRKPVKAEALVEVMHRLSAT